MDFLIEGLSADQQKKVVAGACGLVSCSGFVCGVFTDPCKAVCSGVGCTGVQCDSFGTT